LQVSVCIVRYPRSDVSLGFRHPQLFDEVKRACSRSSSARSRVSRFTTCETKLMLEELSVARHRPEKTEIQLHSSVVRNAWPQYPRPPRKHHAAEEKIRIVLDG
jgi:hypothetical protein